ncbi:succinate dehydrogenase assembly factor 2 [Altericroceibacterium endophyticum]|uniref:FAD assembly factor SdhE n=1 Tax=Altericroceibacterium endophyticum TaxID=1808508 RepID=A0A6I4T5D5_9SPHN|nr:succinate dehydrogenase assembly factor 2 [Altericroceibacterium endophyticum]MXO66057.1 succinate dehydrogenase assembly factor 2 [Altericroceibacterium endophyticum]
MPDYATRIARCRFRAWHRGTREADFMIGGYFDRYHPEWSEKEILWFETLLDENDVDIMAWALGVQPSPPLYDGPMMEALKRLDYIEIRQ